MKLLVLLVAGTVGAVAVTNPPRLSFVTYLGPWSWPDATPYTAAEKSGAMYVSGITESQWFPCNNEAVREPRRGVVAKLRPAGEYAIDVHVGPYSTPLDRFVEVRQLIGLRG